MAPLLALGNLTVEEAIEAVRVFELQTGLTLSLTQQKLDTSDPNLVDKVISTTPLPGTVITESANVVLFVGQLAQP